MDGAAPATESKSAAKKRAKEAEKAKKEEEKAKKAAELAKQKAESEVVSSIPITPCQDLYI